MSCSSETSSAVAVAVPKGNQPAIVQFAFSDLSLHTDGLRWYAKCRHCSATTAATDVHEPTPTKKAKSSLFGHWSSSTDKVVKSDSPAQQLRQFLNCINSDAFVYEETNEILTRNEYCLLRPLFSHVFCIPATSAPIERIFSQSGLVMKPNRARMNDKILEMLVFAHCNAKLM